MSFKPLIQKQKLRIDDHFRGAKEIKSWDHKDKDIHLDKTTTYKIDGKHQTVRIRVPINSDRPITIQYNGIKRYQEIPGNLANEIRKAFANKKKRKNFVEDLVEELKNYDSILSSEEKALAALKNISKHFDLNWTSKKVVTYANEKLVIYTGIFTDKKDELYYLTIDKSSIQIGEIGKYSKHEYKLINLDK